MIYRIAVLGAESSGKTTFCKALSEATGRPWVHEYGRQFGEENGFKYVLADMLPIALRQVALEEVTVDAEMHRTGDSADSYIICDTTPLTTLFYSVEWYGFGAVELENLSRRAYDLVFFCERDFPYVEDGTRQGESFGRKQELFYTRANPNMIHLTGPVSARVEFAKTFLEKYDQTNQP